MFSVFVCALFMEKNKSSIPIVEIFFIKPVLIQDVKKQIFNKIASFIFFKIYFRSIVKPNHLP